jgi:hypothetical protein
MPTNKNSNKNIINILIGDKNKKKRKRKSTKSRRRSDQPLTIVNSTNNSPPINFISPQPPQPPPYHTIHPSVLHQNRSQVPDFVSQAQREDHMRVNDIFLDQQQEQRRNIVNSILNNDNNETNTIQREPNLWGESLNSPLLNQIADEHYMKKIMNKGLQKLQSNSIKSQNNTANELIADEHYMKNIMNKGLQKLQSNKIKSQNNTFNELIADLKYRDNYPSKAFNKIKTYRRPPIKEEKIIGITPESLQGEAQLNQSIYGEINNPFIPSESSQQQWLEKYSIFNNKKQFTAPKQLPVSPETVSSAEKLFRPQKQLQFSPEIEYHPQKRKEIVPITPKALESTKNKLKPLGNKSTPEIMDDISEYFRNENLDDTMTPGTSKRVMTDIDRFLQSPEPNTSNLNIPKTEYKINLTDNKNENESIDLSKFEDARPLDGQVKEANDRYQKALRQQQKLANVERLKARKDVLSSQQNPSLNLQEVQAEQKKKDAYFKAQINNRFSEYSQDPLNYVKTNYNNDFDKLKIWAEKNPNERLGPKSNPKLWKLYTDYLYSSSISNKHPGPSIKGSTLLEKIDELKPSIQKNLKLFKPTGDAQVISRPNRGVVTFSDLQTATSRQSNQLVRVAK